ncbi:hypothetical protein ILUMI_23533 [Ignelater luminosus]|uniref:PiggyBac transposable element-derived protein domain-containing protein n=1 Tax=Ignelater luminosus TaxID=2038154 RepID=A0A8K0CAR3_IGNLU|nr:hypothetical protein ILUMI_23533 [Ignelater luminosus]
MNNVLVAIRGLPKQGRTPPSAGDNEGFVGLLILVGVYKSHNEGITNLWNVEDGRPLFNKTMSKSRFSTISQCLRFDNAEARKRNRDPDKLSPIRAFLNDSDRPYENLTVDEQLLTFRGDQRERNQGKRVALDMTKGLETSGRNVTTDNFFTSLNLPKEMKKKNLTLLGTIRKNKPELLQELVTTLGRDVYSTKFGYQDKAMLASYCQKKGKIVTLLLTMHDSGQISETEKKKPQMIIDCNKTMSGVDTMDKLVRTYACAERLHYMVSPKQRLENKKGYK